MQNAQVQCEPKSTQMNVRMSKSLHDAGCAALAEIGFTPSEAVRALWTIAERRGRDLENVRKLLDPQEAAPSEPQALACARRGRMHVQEYFDSIGLDESCLASCIVVPTDAELRDMQSYDQLNGRSLWDA